MSPARPAASAPKVISIGRSIAVIAGQELQRAEVTDRRDRQGQTRDHGERASGKSESSGDPPRIAFERCSEPGSCRTVVDSDPIVAVGRYEWEMSHEGTGGNRWSLSLSFACHAAQWASSPGALDQRAERAPRQRAVHPAAG